MAFMMVSVKTISDGHPCPDVRNAWQDGALSNVLRMVTPLPQGAESTRQVRDGEMGY